MGAILSLGIPHHHAILYHPEVYDRYDVRLALESATAAASPSGSSKTADADSAVGTMGNDLHVDGEELERLLWMQKQKKWQKNNHCTRFGWGMVFLLAVGLLSIPGMCCESGIGIEREREGARRRERKGMQPSLPPPPPPPSPAAAAAAPQLTAPTDALTLALPPENTTFMHNRALIRFFRNGSSILLSFTNLVLVPLVVDLAGRRAGLDPRNMLLFTKVCTTWLFSSIFYVLFSNDCYGYWFAYWDPCVVGPDGNRSTEFDITIWGDHYKRNIAGEIIGLEELIVIRTEDICSEGVSFTHGTCARGIIEMLTPLLLGKLLIEGLAVPFFTVFVSWPLEAAARKWILGEPRVQGPTEKTEVIVSKILTSLEIAIVLGPLMPIVVPLTGLSILPSLFQFRIGCRDFNAKVVGKNASLGPCWFLALTLMLGQGLAVFFFFDSDLFQGLPIVGVSASICAALSLALLSGFSGTLLNSIDVALDLCFGLGYGGDEFDGPGIGAMDSSVELGAAASGDADRRRPLLLGEDDDEEDFLSL